MSFSVAHTCSFQVFYNTCIFS